VWNMLADTIYALQKKSQLSSLTMGKLLVPNTVAAGNEQWGSC
jgi:hypothetical protein